MIKRFTAIDLFCGCGGMSCGLMQAGWEVVAAVDNSPMALATYYQNLCDENTQVIGNIPKRSAKYFYRHPTGPCSTCKEPDEECQSHDRGFRHCPYAGWMTGQRSP